jgi:hypothetical protein
VKLTALAPMLLLLAGPSFAQTCVPLTRADVRALPREAIDKVYCSVRNESLRATSAVTAAVGLAEEREAWRIDRECSRAYLATLSLYRERFGDKSPLPKCDTGESAPKRPTLPTPAPSK